MNGANADWLFWTVTAGLTGLAAFVHGDV